jgi:paraquat-inducible protein B
MDASLQPTLDQVNAAMDAVNTALQDPSISDPLQSSLQNASNVLQETQDSLINKSEQDLVDALSASNTQLATLSQQVNDEVTALGKVSADIQKAANAIGGLTSVLAAIL